MMGTGSEGDDTADANDLRSQSTSIICLTYSKSFGVQNQVLKDADENELHVCTDGEWKFPASTEGSSTEM